MTAIGTRLDELAEAAPDRPALTVGATTVTRGELRTRTNQLARRFERAGAREGSFVTVALPNSLRHVEAVIALWKLGAIPQPVSHRLPFGELTAILELAQPSLVISDLDVPEAWSRVGSGVDASAEEASDLAPCTSPAWKAPTSGGSTGRPKLIVSTTPGLAEPLLPLAAMVGMTPDGEHLMTGPLHHNAPFIYAFTALLTGNHVVLMERFDAEETLRLVAEHAVDWLYLVPTMMLRIWRLPEPVRVAHDLSSLRAMFHIAAPCAPWLKDAWIEWLGPERILELYGGTDGLASTFITGTEWLAHRGSVGRPFRGAVKVVGPGGQELPAGVEGEVYMWAAEDQRNYRYIGAEAKVLDGWESLGDVGWLDEDGYLYLGDRLADMILVGGENVYPAEVEAALDEHPLVLSSCVIGIPDEDRGNRVHAIVELAGDLDDEVLASHLAARLAPWKRPSTFERSTAPLRDDAGKVRRSALRRERLALP